MNGMFVLLLFFMQAATPIAIPDRPIAPGVYYRQSVAKWILMPSARVAQSKAKGLDIYVETGGYTNLDMDVSYNGEQALLRIAAPKPTFFIRDVGASTDLAVVRLTQKKDLRMCQFSPPVATVDNKLGFKRSDLVKTVITEYPDKSFSVTPEEELRPGEYLLIFDKATSGYDFGIN